MLEKIKRWSKKKYQSAKSWFKNQPWGRFVAGGLAALTMVGFVVGITIATEGWALIGFGGLWFSEGLLYKSSNSPEPFMLTKVVFALLVGFYEYIGRSIYNAFNPSIVNEQQPLLNVNDTSISEANLDQNILLTSINQQLSAIKNIELALQEQEEKRNSQLPPIVIINSLEEIPTPQLHIQGNPVTNNDGNSTSAAINIGFFSDSRTQNDSFVTSLQQPDKIENLTENKTDQSSEKKLAHHK